MIYVSLGRSVPRVLRLRRIPLVIRMLLLVFLTLRCRNNIRSPIVRIFVVLRSRRLRVRWCRKRHLLLRIRRRLLVSRLVRNRRLRIRIGSRSRLMSSRVLMLRRVFILYRRRSVIVPCVRLMICQVTRLWVLWWVWMFVLRRRMICLRRYVIRRSRQLILFVMERMTLGVWLRYRGWICRKKKFLWVCLIRRALVRCRVVVCRLSRKSCRLGRCLCRTRKIVLIVLRRRVLLMLLVMVMLFGLRRGVTLRMVRRKRWRGIMVLVVRVRCWVPVRSTRRSGRLRRVVCLGTRIVMGLVLG